MTRLNLVDTKALVVFIVGLFCLPIAVAYILLWALPLRDQKGLIFNFACSGAMLGWIALFILWTRQGYGRKWQQFQSRSWRQIEGRFDEGEIVTLKKGRSGKIAGYQVWLGYDYLADGEQTGLYTIPFVGEFPTQEVAEKYRKRVANRNVVVRVSPRNSTRSCVLDEDVRPLIGEQD